MSAARLNELLAAYALDNPSKPLSGVTVLEFAEWHSTREKWARLEESWERYNRSLSPAEQRD